MRPAQVFLACACLALFSLVIGVSGGSFGARSGSAVLAAGNGHGVQGGDKLVFADFENIKDNRPVSNGGGQIQLIGYQQNETMKSRFTGQQGSNPAAPELVRLKKDDPNHAIAFDFQILAPNDWAGVGVEIDSRESKDGKAVAIDASGYKYITLQLYATGAQFGRVEVVSRDNGLAISKDFPQAPFQIKPGFNTYQVAFSQLTQSQWADTRVATKDILKKLTAVNVWIYCQQCTPMSGKVVMDNVVFTK